MKIPRIIKIGSSIELIYQLHFLRNFRKKCNIVKSVMVDELNINYYYYNYNHKLRHFVLLLLITYCNVC